MDFNLLRESLISLLDFLPTNNNKMKNNTNSKVLGGLGSVSPSLALSGLSLISELIKKTNRMGNELKIIILLMVYTAIISTIMLIGGVI